MVVVVFNLFARVDICQVASGILDVATPEGMHVSMGGLVSSTTGEGGVPLTARADGRYFKGTVLRLEAADGGDYPNT